MHPDNVTAGDNVTLECITSVPSCQPSVIWFKDGRPLTEPLLQAQKEDSGNYICAFKGQESSQSDPVALDVQCKHVYQCYCWLKMRKLYVSV